MLFEENSAHKRGGRRLIAVGTWGGSDKEEEKQPNGANIVGT
jgi:hypothetical protein